MTGNEARASWFRFHIWMGRGGGLATVCTPHVCSPLSHPSFSFLHSAVEDSFDIKKACEKPYNRLIKKISDLYSVIQKRITYLELEC